MKVKKIGLLVSLCMAVALFSSTFALASDSSPSSGVDPAYEGPEIVVEGEVDQDEEDTLTRNGRSVNTSVNFSLNSGSSWSKSFNMSNGSSPPHNAFKVVVSNFSGNQYRIIVEGNQGLSFAKH